MLRGLFFTVYCGLACSLQASNSAFLRIDHNRLGLQHATRHLTIMLASSNDSANSNTDDDAPATSLSSSSPEIQRTKKATNFPIPSLQVLLMGVIFGQAANGLSTVVPLFLQATDSSRSSFALPILLNLGLMGWASLELGKNFGLLGKVRVVLRLCYVYANIFAQD